MDIRELTIEDIPTLLEIEKDGDHEMLTKEIA